MQVELQIRSKVQHSWATAVEVVGTFTKQALKASSGDPRWLEFFRLVSVEFAKLEGCKVDPIYQEKETFVKMDLLLKELEVEERLRAFKVATKAITGKKQRGAGYFVLILDLSEKVINHIYFSKDDLSGATNCYYEYEKQHESDTTKDVVLVSAASVKDLKRAYPNYFADTIEFEKNITKIYLTKN